MSPPRDEWEFAPKLFHDFNEPDDREGRYRVVVPKHVVVGESSLEINGYVEAIVDLNESCFVLHVRPVGKYRDFADGRWWERSEREEGV